MADEAVDVLIIGGGLTGALLLLALKQTGYRALLIDASSFDIKMQADFDSRSLALSLASMRILSMLEVWPSLATKATAINNIHVSEQKRFGVARLSSQTKQPLGFVVEMQDMYSAVWPLLAMDSLLAPASLMALDQEHNVATIEESGGNVVTLKAKLIVAADGADSFVRKLLGLKAEIKNYHQSAIVANVGLARPHRGYAYERFTSSGPLALLPMSENRSSLVWSLPREKANQILQLSDDAFIHALYQEFGYRLGRLVKIGRRGLYPLKQVIMKQQTFGSTVFIGNAAHTLHPVAGQGFNLGLRDVALLAQCLIQYGINTNALDIYEQHRKHDQTAITFFTNGLVDVFTSKRLGLSFARNVGLIALDNLPSAKRILSRYASGFAGVIPDLVCQIPLVAENL
ncbi:FAD-dependent monooxygenase [Legionella impletisoli]|uniref:2-octaprenyl-6-methoxyphenol hydroxylase n=1 Tax=Legionella impletisoli TaxID=343510 RepID=A0A917JVL9_9GAMM|nr:FAD-dependent monooxygenase [Legionella impletisoli]GGI87134.1 2-octaprenyl-6-methoxyphenol hydroxylase [Legionella impletisoli]